MPITAGLLVTAGTEGTPLNSRNAGYKYQQQQGCQPQFCDASNSRAGGKVVLKTEIERIHVQKNKDTSGQPAADNSSNEESTTGMPARAGTPAIAGRQQKRPPQLCSQYKSF